MTFAPFAVESYGVGPAARKLLLKLASRSDELTTQAFLSDALTRLSVALQRGNALVLQWHAAAARLLAAAGCGRPAHRPDAAPFACQPASSAARGCCRWAADGFDLAHVFHASMHAGGGDAAARSFRHRRVTVEGAG